VEIWRTIVRRAVAVVSAPAKLYTTVSTIQIIDPHRLHRAQSFLLQYFRGCAFALSIHVVNDRLQHILLHALDAGLISFLDGFPCKLEPVRSGNASLNFLDCLPLVEGQVQICQSAEVLIKDLSMADEVSS
jgi:hypothetical protein